MALELVVSHLRIASSGCEWAGICETVSVISSAPPVSARIKPLP